MLAANGFGRPFRLDDPRRRTKLDLMNGFMKHASWLG
jgi:hypothetical protein